MSSIQPNGCTPIPCPVGLETSLPTRAASTYVVKATDAAASRLASMTSSTLSVVDAASTNLALIQDRFEKLKQENIELVKESAALEQQLMLSESHHRETRSVYSLQEKELEAQIATVSLNVISIMETITEEMGAIQGNMQQLTNANLRLLAENSLLSQQLVASSSRESEISRVHNVQEKALRAQIASMQAQMAAQIAQAEAEAQRLQTLPVTAQREKTEAVAAVQAVGDQQRIELNQQKREAQAQVNNLSAEKNRLNAEVVSLTGKCLVLQTQISGEPLRQQAAMIQKLTPIKTQLDYVIDRVGRQIENLELDYRRQAEAVHTGIHYGLSFRKGDLVWTQGTLTSLSKTIKP